MASGAARLHSPASGSAGAAATQSHSLASGSAGAALTGQGHPYTHNHIGCKLPRGEDVQQLKDLQLIALDLQATSSSWVAQSWNWCHRHFYEIEDDLKRLNLWFACATSRMDVVSSMAEAVKIKDQCIAKDQEAKVKLYPVLEKLREDMEGARAGHWRQSGSCGSFQPESEPATGGSLARTRSRSRSPVWSNNLPQGGPKKVKGKDGQQGQACKAWGTRRFICTCGGPIDLYEGIGMGAPKGKANDKGKGGPKVWGTRRFICTGGGPVDIC